MNLLVSILDFTQIYRWSTAPGELVMIWGKNTLLGNWSITLALMGAPVALICPILAAGIAASSISQGGLSDSEPHKPSQVGNRIFKTYFSANVTRLRIPLAFLVFWIPLAVNNIIVFKTNLGSDFPLPFPIAAMVCSAAISFLMVCGWVSATLMGISIGIGAGLILRHRILSVVISSLITLPIMFLILLGVVGDLVAPLCTLPLLEWIADWPTAAFHIAFTIFAPPIIGLTAFVVTGLKLRLAPKDWLYS